MSLAQLLAAGAMCCGAYGLGGGPALLLVLGYILIHLEVE